MVRQKLKDIDVKKLKMAKQVIAVLEILGITEEDLDLLKTIPEMKREIAELKEFKAEQLRIQRNEAKVTLGNQKTINQKTLYEAFGNNIKEFNPYGRKESK